MLKKYAGEEFLVLEIPLREKFMIPCKYIYPWWQLITVQIILYPKLGLWRYLGWYSSRRLTMSKRFGTTVVIRDMTMVISF